MNFWKRATHQQTTQLQPGISDVGEFEELSEIELMAVIGGLGTSASVNIPQCSGNKQLKLIDVNAMVNLLADGNTQIKDVCQINNEYYV